MQESGEFAVLQEFYNLDNWVKSLSHPDPDLLSSLSQ